MASYKDAGVDIDAGNESVRLIKDKIKTTFNKNVLTGIGAFGGAFSLAGLKGMKEPVLVSTIDGVGTKLKVAAKAGKWNNVGRDIVNHCSNDILGLGAKPLFFLDYIAASKIEPKRIEEIVSGMADACKEFGCALIGGETAEMPGVYEKGEHDLAGCMIGVVDRKKIIDGSKIKKGDCLIGIASNGLHTNGYSLARKVLFEDAGFSVEDSPAGLGTTLGEALLQSHRSYSKVVLALSEKISVKGIAHITGGGLIENVPRIIPSGLKAEFDYTSIPKQPIFELLKEKGELPDSELYRVFNMGVGLVVVVKKSDASFAVDFLSKKGEIAWVFGRVM